jgi:exonuclease III
MSICSLNCNSLNLACSNESFDLKISSIASLNYDIILLCDLRMGEIGNRTSEFKVKSALLKTNLSKYDCYFHSTLNRRGVAMLIAKKLNMKELAQYKDLNENILIIKFEKDGGELCLGSVYGPNSTDRDFYNFITEILRKENGIPFLLGGDWNTTWDNSPPETNIDVHNMARTPNAANGKLLRNMAELFALTDPFRAINPNKSAFSYSPFGTQRKNCSRIDFFLISTDLLSAVTKCDIFSAQLSNMFDHKPIV